MKIGIDFDDVINEFTDSLMDFYHKKYGKKVIRDEIRKWDWGLYWGIDREEATKRVDEFHATHNIEDLKPLEDAIKSLKSLIKKYELIIITGRPVRFKWKVQSWLKNKINRDLKIINAGEWHKGQGASKMEICKELNIQILLEDAPNTALDCAKNGIKVILFNKPWNHEVKHKFILRVENWKEAMKEINKLENYLGKL